MPKVAQVVKSGPFYVLLAALVAFLAYLFPAAVPFCDQWDLCKAQKEEGTKHGTPTPAEISATLPQ